MTGTTTYSASCHCGGIRFTFSSEELTTGVRCNCSICVRKGVVMSSAYFPPEDVSVQGTEFLGLYRFGDEDVNHHFCTRCGVYPFNVIASVPPTYDGPARPGDYRINLGCVDELDAFALEIDVIDGRSF